MALPVDLRLLWPAGVVDVDGLPLAVGVEGGRAGLAIAVAGAAGAAEGQLHLGADGAGVYIDDAGGYLFHRLERHAHVARIDGGDQTVGHVVVDRHRLVEVGEGDDVGHGAEDLLLSDAHAGPDVREDGGLEEVAAVQAIAGGARAADGYLRALLAADLHVALYLLELGPVDDRADLPRPVEAAADAQRAGARHQLPR